MEIKKEMVTKEKYSTKCPRCDAEITGVSVKQLNHNFKLHKFFCKGAKKK